MPELLWTPGSERPAVPAPAPVDPFLGAALRAREPAVWAPSRGVIAQAAVLGVRHDALAADVARHAQAAQKAQERAERAGESSAAKPPPRARAGRRRRRRGR